MAQATPSLKVALASSHMNDLEPALIPASIDKGVKGCMVMQERLATIQCVMATTKRHQALSHNIGHCDDHSHPPIS
jgi:predicted component of type VI protein secretion system